MEAVGYDMYVRLLNEAVSLMKGEPLKKAADETCLVDMQVEAHIPESYIDSVNLRLEVYRRIAQVETQEDAMDVMDELIDRFGEPPEAVKGLIDIALLRGTASELGVSEVKQQGESLLLYMAELDMERVGKLVKGMNGRVLLSAGSRPYLSVKLRRGQSPLKALEEVLGVMRAS